MIGRAQFALNEPILNVYRDTTGVREVLRVEAQDGHTAFRQFENDGIGVLIVVVGDDENCGRHGRTSAILDRDGGQDFQSCPPSCTSTGMESRNGDSCSPSCTPPV